MKSLLIIIFLVLTTFSVQTTEISEEDKIKQTALGYLIALQKMKPDLMKKVMHEKLAKRITYLDNESGKYKLHDTTYEKMIEYAGSWNKDGDKFPAQPSNEVIILDKRESMASVKLVSDNWYEYLHLAKLDGEWKIINLYWQNK